MKYLTPKTMTLTAAALLSSFALSAEAAPLALSSARQTHGSNHAKNLIHRLLFPADTYMIDDGTAEDSVGLTAGGDTIALNEFSVIPGSETISSVDIAWGTPAFFDPSLDGLPYTVCLWSDPNGDGDPTDAVLLTTAKGVVTQQGTDTFSIPLSRRPPSRHQTSSSASSSHRLKVNTHVHSTKATRC